MSTHDKPSFVDSADTVSCSLYGCTCAQTVYYFHKYPKDRIYLKALVCCWHCRLIPHEERVKYARQVVLVWYEALRACSESASALTTGQVARHRESNSGDPGTRTDFSLHHNISLSFQGNLVRLDHATRESSHSTGPRPVRRSSHAREPC